MIFYICVGSNSRAAAQFYMPPRPHSAKGKEPHMSTTAAKTNETVKSRMSTRDIVLIGMFAALLAAFSQISLPMPTGVPITIQAFGVALVGVVLGWKRALFSTIVYILLGAVGLPVFANFQGGLRVITGLTGGYILAWPVMAALCGASIPVKSASAPVSLFFPSYCP